MSWANPSISFFAEEDRVRLQPTKLLRMAARCGRCEFEGWRVRKDGSRFWSSSILNAIYDEDRHRIVGFAKFTRDVSERRAAEQALIRRRQPWPRQGQSTRAECKHDRTHPREYAQRSPPARRHPVIPSVIRDPPRAARRSNIGRAAAASICARGRCDVSGRTPRAAYKAASASATLATWCSDNSGYMGRLSTSAAARSVA
jgi:hypothetical protein